MAQSLKRMLIAEVVSQGDDSDTAEIFREAVTHHDVDDCYG